MAAELTEIVQAYPERRRRRSLGSRIRRVLRGARWRLALGLIGSAFRVAKAGGRTYQPVEIGGKRFANVRDTDERWQAVSQVLRDYEARNVLDIGCAEGWFVRRAAAECNCFAIGIEATDTAIVGELARLHDRVQRAATVRAFMTPEAIRSLPQFDAVLCLSVLHHVIRAFGIAAAEQFLRALSTRVGKVLIFEIGTADESFVDAVPARGEPGASGAGELRQRAVAALRLPQCAGDRRERGLSSRGAAAVVYRRAGSSRAARCAGKPSGRLKPNCGPWRATKPDPRGSRRNGSPGSAARRRCPSASCALPRRSARRQAARDRRP